MHRGKCENATVQQHGVGPWKFVTRLVAKPIREKIKGLDSDFSIWTSRLWFRL